MVHLSIDFTLIHCEISTMQARLVEYILEANGLSIDVDECLPLEKLFIFSELCWLSKP